MSTFNYLKEIRHTFYTKPQWTISFIIGSTSCDVDSFLSAYLLSIGKNIRSNSVVIDNTNQVSINKSTSELYLPVFNCKRGELYSRLDVMYLLDKFDIKEEDFLYINDPELSDAEFKNSSRKRNIILVDHSTPGWEYPELHEYVVEWYDHHFSLNLTYPNLIKKYIKYPIGSCSTLILVDYFLSKFPHSIVSPLWAVTAILIDTQNFNQKLYGNGWSFLDKMVYEKIINLIPNHMNMDDYFRDLYGIRHDVQMNLQLGIENIFQKDMQTFVWEKKAWVWSSLQIKFETIITHFGIDKIVEFYNDFKKNDEKWCNSIDYFVASARKETGSKEFYIYWYDDQEISKIKKEDLELFMKEHFKNMFIKAEINKEGNKNFIFVELDDIATRKNCEPVFRKYFTERI